MDQLLADLRFALRMLRRTPGVTAVALMTLALGIGANSAIFSVVDAVLLRPLPYRDAHQLVMINGKFPRMQLFRVGLSGPELKDVASQMKTLASVGAYEQGDFNLSGGSTPPERVIAGLASSGLFPTLGVQPILGRFFAADEAWKGNDRVVVIDHGLWQRRFGGDSNVLGKLITLDNDAYRIIGVLPPGFRIERQCEVWLPLSSSIEMLEKRSTHWLKVVGRMKPGVTAQMLTAELAGFSSRLTQAYPGNYKSGGWELEWRPLRDEVVGNVRPALLVLLGAVACVLLIACANVANLMLARAAARQREMAIRAALGAGRARLMRQLLTESLLLALFGGGLGLVLAMWGLDAIIAASPDALPRVREIALDGRVVAFTCAVALATGVAFGLVPALAASRVDLNDALKEGGRGTTAARGRLRQALVVVEVMLSLVLLVGAGLMLRSFWRLGDVRPGLDANHVLTLRVSLPETVGSASDEERQRWVHWFERAQARLGQLPGVTTVGAVNHLPFDGRSSDTSFQIEGYMPPDGAEPDNELRVVLPGYFQALGIPLVRGRLIAAGDAPTAPSAVVINQAMARRYWHGDEDPIGKRLKIDAGGANGPWCTIVGIVGDVHGFGLDVAPRAEMYFPYAQSPGSASLALVLRTTVPPESLVPTVQAVMSELDPNQPIYDLRPMTDLVASSLARRRFSLGLMLLFAVVALLLAAVGIYGVMAYTVAQRTHEIGVRVALGARPTDVMKMVVRDGMRLVLFGLGLGLAAALLLTRVVSSLLYGISTTDASTYVAIAAVLALVALVAVLLPARRATRIEPMVALRTE
jgi:putative ABC transport system permease protein